MPPHIFKEQLKLVFGIKVTIPELSAILAYFGNPEFLNCRDFIIRFVKMGLDERSKQRVQWRLEDKAKREKALADEEAALEKNGLRGATDVDFNFSEDSLDSGLEKLIKMVLWNSRFLSSFALRSCRHNISFILW